MYLTAQRVRSPRGATGVNVALYLHTGTALPEDTWTLAPHQMVERVATTSSGRLATSRVTIKPGGNSVESSIDVAAPDGTSLADVQAAVRELRSAGVAKPPVTVRVGDVTAEFTASRAVEDPSAAFNELAESALALYAKPEPPAWTATSPLTVRVQNNDEGWTFQLDEESAGRVIAAGGRPARVRVRYDVADDFRQVYGPLYPHAAQWVTNLSGEALLGLGGAKFINRGTIVGEWPARG